MPNFIFMKAFLVKVNAGIDTTGNTLAFLLYNLARFPEKQARLN